MEDVDTQQLKNPGTGPATDGEDAPPHDPMGLEEGELGRTLLAFKSGALDLGATEKAVSRIAVKVITNGIAMAAATGQGRMPPAEDGGLPGWAKLPQDIAPPRGRQIVAMRFPSKWTAAPGRGVSMPDQAGLWRWCVTWQLTDSEEFMALERSRGDAHRAALELSKQMIRVVDGHAADWSGKRTEPGSIDQWWTEIGAKCRAGLNRVYNQLHVMNPAEMVFFFESCVEVRNTG